MNFPISHSHLAPPVLVALGFVVGALGGFFGVGGSFLAGPALFGLGLPMNFVIGTDLAHIVGKSIVAARKHHFLGNLDRRLALLMVLGTVPGVEAGARTVEMLKRAADIDLVIGVAFIFILVAVSGFMAWEGWATLKKGPPRAAAKKGDHSAFSFVAKRVQRLRLPPYVSLPVSGIPRVSIWAIIGVSVAGGYLSGLLGGGAGYIRMPSMIYLLGVPTHIAVGTDLFEVIISAGVGTFTHALKGNVDILIALVMHAGAALGAQLGAYLTQYISGPRIRLAFVPLPLIGAAIVAHALLTGQHAP
ncbi:MAG TPA: sulfite exporter TauE/SafE family protein [Lacunisphaera sp.]|nr:sulfite exporter TauE/SafE family protein [Lacunisphaera sp.]